MKKSNRYKVDGFGRPIFKVIFNDGSFYYASPNFTLNEMTPKKIREFKKEIRNADEDDPTYVHEDDAEEDCLVIKQIRFK